MGLLCEFDICADFGFIEQTEEFGIVPDYSEGCRVFRETFLRVSRDIVPVDTGYLRSTLTADYNDTFCYAETECEYAQYVEYGTWKQRAQPYFEPAIEEALLAAESYWMDAQDEALEEEEMLMQEMIEEAEEEMATTQGTSSQSSSSFSWGGAILGSLVVALVSTFLHELIGFAFTERGESSFSGASGALSGGGGIVYMPDIEIT